MHRDIPMLSMKPKDKRYKDMVTVSLTVVVTVSYGLRTKEKAVETTEDQVIHYRQTLPKQGYCLPEGGL